MNKKRWLGIIVMCMPFLLYAQSDDFGLWTTMEVTKKIFPGLDASIEGEFRLRDDWKTMDRYAGTIDLSYRVIKYLKVGGNYSLIRFNHEKRGWETGHRYSLYATGSYKWNRFNISLRERYQHTYRKGVSSTSKRANPKDVLRSRLQLSYDIAKSGFNPYASVEVYHTLNDPQGNGLEKTRYTFGTSYKLNRKNTFDLFYRYINKEDEDEANGHILGVGYSFKF